MPTPITSGILLVLAAGAAQAQTLVPVLQELPDGRTVERTAPLYRLTAESRGGRYSERGTRVFNSMSNFSQGPVGLACTHTLDAFSFAPGPWASVSTRVASRLALNFWIAPWQGEKSPAFNVHCQFYTGSAFASAIGDSMLPKSSTVFADRTYHFAEGAVAQRPDPGSIVLYYFLEDLSDSTPGSEQIRFTGDSFLFESRIEDPDQPRRLAWYPSAGATNPDPVNDLYIPPGESTASPTQPLGFWANWLDCGSATDSGYGRDMNGDGTFTYAPVVSGGGFTTPTDLRDYRSSGNRHYAMQIFGNICPCRADFDASGGTPDVSDIEAYFSSWLGGEPEADVDCSSGTPDTTDIELFFAQWLAGGCA